MTDEAGQKRPRWGLRVLVALLAIVVVAGVALAVAVHHRQEQERLGLGPSLPRSAPRCSRGSTGRTGSFTAQIDFTSMATGAETISTEVAWDDNWFFADPTEYNHELATTCSVLSAVANSESGYYQKSSDSPAYMEEALAELGFEDISTASYQYRSEIFDEVVDFLGTDDVVAYSVATKRVTADDGREKTLYLVSVRGSYGSEWLSDLNMGDAADYEMDAIDHEGFMRAANEIVDDLAERITREAGDGGTDDVALLFCGHSRGAATANLAASYADDMTQGLRVLAPLESIYCYTFATPELTTVDNTGDELYDNIFNILKTKREGAAPAACLVGATRATGTTCGCPATATRDLTRSTRRCARSSRQTRAWSARMCPEIASTWTSSSRTSRARFPRQTTSRAREAWCRSYDLRRREPDAGALRPLPERVYRLDAVAQGL